MAREFEYAHNPDNDQLSFAHGTGRFGVPGGQGFKLMPLATDRAAAAITQFFHHSYLNIKRKYVAYALDANSTTAGLIGPITLWVIRNFAG